MNERKKSLGYLEGWLSAVINTILFGVKYWAGVTIDSVAMKADAWHTLSDTLTSIIVIFGFWIASRKADDKHPFGHGRAEAIAAVIIGTLLFVVGSKFMIDSVQRLTESEGVSFNRFGIIVFLCSFFIKEALARFSIWAGQKVDSRALIADGWHHRSDAIASALIVAGALWGSYFWWIDGVAGILVSLLIFYATFDILKGAVSTLIGEIHDVNIENRLNTLVQRISPMLSDIHHLHVHRYGDNIELTFHVRFPPRMSLKRAHDIANSIETAVRNELSMEATIHLEPNRGKTA